MSRGLTPWRAEMAFWTLLCGGLAVGIGQETDWGKRWQYPIADASPAPATFSKPTLSDPYRLPAADDFLEIAMRPLFVPTRRPAPAAPPPEPPKPSMIKDQFTLSGITVTPGGKFAFLIEKAGNKPRVVSEGREINGIRIKEIAADRVVLSQYDDTEILVLKTGKGSATPPPAPTGATGTPAVPAMPAWPVRPPVVPVPGMEQPPPQ